MSDVLLSDPTSETRARDLEADGSAGGRTRGTLTERLFRPGWPLAAILVPFPLWWVLGLSEWIVPLMVVPMTLHLLRTSGVLAPRGFGWWLAFLLWVTAGGFLLQVDALGAVADDSSTRLITFGYRLVWYVSITVVLLYVINLRRELTVTRVTRMVACLFVTITFGGLLGVLAPYLEFKSLMELVLPSSLTRFQLIKTMIHPTAAQLQEVLGYVAPRPSAPFAYTNTWGLNFALTLPFFLFAWLGKDSGWRRWAAAPVLLVAAVPFIYSVNRGMWGACVAMALFVAVRAALTGRPGVLAGITAGGAVLALLLSVSPLGTIVSARFAGEGSEQGRTNLGSLALRSVTATSPVVGLGSTRNVQGNFQSITGGSTAQCPRCSPPSLGTQGQLWLVVFSQGLVGLVLFLVFFATIFLRHVRLRSPVVTVALAAMVAWAVTMAVYNSLGIGMLVVMIAVALLCREGGLDTSAGPQGREDRSLSRLDRYTGAFRTGLPVILVCALLGSAVGWWWHQENPTPYAATSSVVLPEPPRYPSPGYARTNVDTEAQLVAGSTVRSAAARASGESSADIAEHLTVTATPNTRVLQLKLTAPTADRAMTGVEAATDTLLQVRSTRLELERDVELERLRRIARSVEKGVDTLDGAVAEAEARTAGTADTISTSSLLDRRNQLLAQANLVANQSARIHGLVLAGGRRTRATVLTQSPDQIRVDVVSGATAGIAVGALLVLLWGARGPRVRRVRDVRDSTGLPLLAEVPNTPEGFRAVADLFEDRPLAYVAASERDASALGFADRLSGVSPSPDLGSGAVVVASDRTRVEDVLACRNRLGRQGITVRGVLLALPPRTRLRGSR